MRLPSVVCVLAAAGLSLLPAAAQAADTEPGVLGAVTARSGTLTPRAHGLDLVLRGVSARGTWFTDRPAHDAGTAPVSRLVDAFFGPGEALPNGALAIDGRKGATVVVELSRPRSADGGRTLRFAARELEDVPARLSSFGRTGALPRRFGGATLFIDSTDQACQVDVTVPSTSTLQQGSVSFSGTFGTDPSWAQTQTGIHAANDGEMFYGCGSTMTASYEDATVASGGYTVTVTWSNPMTGTNSSSCTAQTPAGQPVACDASPPPAHGGQIGFGFGVDGAPAVPSALL